MPTHPKTQNLTETRLALFQAISRSVNASLVLEDIFNALGHVLQTFLPSERGVIAIFDDTQNTIKVVVDLDEEGHADVKGEQVIFTGSDAAIHALLKNPVAQLVHAPLETSLLFKPDAKTAIVSPLVNKGVMIGCIGLSGEAFTATDSELLAEVSEQLAVAIENARLYLQTQTQAGREFLINHITRAIRQSLEIQKILETVSQEVGKVMGVSRCVIHYWGASDAGSRHFEYTMPGIAMLEEPQAFSELERSLFSKRLNPRDMLNPFILNDIGNLDNIPPLLQNAGIISLAVFPIVLQETDFVGAISLHQCDVARAWIEEDIALMQAIAEHVAVALSQANLFEETENQRKQLEEALTELQQAQMQLIQSEKMAVLGQFVAGIAHEVNTPLGTLMSNDDTVKQCLQKMSVTDPKSEKLQQSALDLLNINKMASERIQEIVKNLRNFARLDESDLKHANLHEGLDATLTLIHNTIKHKIRVIKNYGEIPEVECFPGLLNQVFMNLLVNASHSIEDKGTITITTQCDPDTRVVRVMIVDTGKGIDPKHLPRIFDPGFTTKGVGVGTGLGLALCYKIMEKHHGRIEVDSTLGTGTTMTVILPVRQTGFTAKT